MRLWSTLYRTLSVVLVNLLRKGVFVSYVAEKGRDEGVYETSREDVCSSL
jgi:hypothetical protein